MTDFSHIRELLAKATPGEWAVGIWKPETDSHTRHAIEGSDQATLAVMSFPDDGCDEVNAALIAALRNNAEAMLDRIKKLEAVERKARYLCKHGTTSRNLQALKAALDRKAS